METRDSFDNIWPTLFCNVYVSTAFSMKCSCAHTHTSFCMYTDASNEIIICCYMGSGGHIYIYELLLFRIIVYVPFIIIILITAICWNCKRFRGCFKIAMQFSFVCAVPLKWNISVCTHVVGGVVFMFKDNIYMHTNCIFSM